MVQCPVCEHQQVNGFECDVCGKDLRPAGSVVAAAAVVVAPLADFEATIPKKVGEVQVERVGELEASRFEQVNVPNERVAELEATRMPALPAPPAEVMADLTTDRVPDDGQRTALPQTRTCRYCGQPLTAGPVCNHCGRGSGLAAVPKPAGSAAPAPWVRCRACGAPGFALEMCKECGRFVPLPEK